MIGRIICFPRNTVNIKLFCTAVIDEILCSDNSFIKLGVFFMMFTHAINKKRTGKPVLSKKIVIL